MSYIAGLWKISFRVIAAGFAPPLKIHHRRIRRTRKTIVPHPHQEAAAAGEAALASGRGDA
jgi:hypothetical protein